MIYLDILTAPNENYCGERHIQKNEISLGNSGDIFIDTPSLIQNISLLIIEKNLVLKSEFPLQSFFVNKKKSSCPVILQKGDTIELDDFKIRIIDYFYTKEKNYKKELSHTLKNSQKDPGLMNLINKITDKI